MTRPPDPNQRPDDAQIRAVAQARNLDELCSALNDLELTCGMGSLTALIDVRNLTVFSDDDPHDGEAVSYDENSILIYDKFAERGLINWRTMARKDRLSTAASVAPSTGSGMLPDAVPD